MAARGSALACSSFTVPSTRIVWHSVNPQADVYMLKHNPKKYFAFTHCPQNYRTSWICSEDFALLFEIFIACLLGGNFSHI